MFYALLAVLLWPSERAGSSAPFVAARAVGATLAKAIWITVWSGLAFLALVGSGRSPQGVHDLIVSADTSQPNWLGAVDRWAGSVVAHHGLSTSLALAVVFVAVGIGVFLPNPLSRATLSLGLVTAAVIWVVGQGFGMILAGGATDPNSGPLLIVLVLAYWPVRARRPYEIRPTTSPSGALLAMDRA